MDGGRVAGGEEAGVLCGDGGGEEEEEAEEGCEEKGGFVHC